MIKGMGYKLDRSKKTRHKVYSLAASKYEEYRRRCCVHVLGACDAVTYATDELGISQFEDVGQELSLFNDGWPSTIDLTCPRSVSRQMLYWLDAPTKSAPNFQQHDFKNRRALRHIVLLFCAEMTK